MTVGAVDTHGTAKRSDDTLAAYSSKGPTRYDLVIKPDLVAPGSRIVSAEAAESYLARTYAKRHVAGGGANAYMQLSGTSMAAGVVSGAAALLLRSQAGADAAGDQGGPAADEHVHAVGRAGGRGRGHHQRAGGGRAG